MSAVRRFELHRLMAETCRRRQHPTAPHFAAIEDDDPDDDQSEEPVAVWPQPEVRLPQLGDDRDEQTRRGAAQCATGRRRNGGWATRLLDVILLNRNARA